MINKIFLLLPIITLSACVTAKSEKIKEIEEKCEYYKNTENFLNKNLLNDYLNIKSAYLILENKNFSCENSVCMTLANGNKWDFIEVELDGNPYNINEFPKNGDFGLYRIFKDFNLYNEFYKISQDKTQIKSIMHSCQESSECISCSSGKFCLVGHKIEDKTSKLTIKRNSNIFQSKNNNTILLNYHISINNELFSDINQFTYSIKQPYSSFGYGICTNSEKIKPIMIDVLGGYRYE